MSRVPIKTRLIRKKGRPIKKPRLSTDLVWRISLALVLLASLLAWAHCRALLNPMRQELDQTAGLIADKLAGALKTHLWNLDEPSIAAYMLSHPLDKDVAEVRVVTQFNEPLYQVQIKKPVDPLIVTRKIYWQEEWIGDVTAVISRDRIQAARSNIVRFNVVMAIIGVSAVLLITGTFLSLSMSRPLLRLAQEMRRLAAGDYAHRLPDSSRHYEVSLLYGEANTMADQIAERTRQLQKEIGERKQKEQELRHLKESLENLVQERTAALTEANKRLREEVAERKQAQEEILRICTYEQQRIGRDLHDSIGQHMVASFFSANALADRLDGAQHDEAGSARQLVQMLSDGIDKIRRLAKGMTGVELEDEGLVLALQQLALDTEQAYGITCRTHTGDRYLIQDKTLSSHLYLITQEAITNAARHGEATSIHISLSMEDGIGRLTVSDNGNGLPDDYETRDGIGRRTMRYRAEAVGGTLLFEPNDGGGTTVVCRFKTAMPAAVG